MKKLLDEMIDEASELEPIFDAADEIRRLEDEIAEETKAKSYNIVRRLIGRQRELQHRLAVDFGERRGWRLADKPFGIDALIRGKVSGRNDWEVGPHPYFDHCSYYRLNRRAAAIAAHLYDFTLREERCAAYADEAGLTLEIPDYPSWYYPGFSKLFVYIGPVTAE